MKRYFILTALGISLLFICAGCGTQKELSKNNTDSGTAVTQNANENQNSVASGTNSTGIDKNMSLEENVKDRSNIGKNSGSLSDSDSTISEGDAKLIALEYLGLNEDQVTLTKNKLEMEDQRYFYEMEFYSDDQMEYEITIDAKTGEVVDYSYDLDHSAAQNHTDSGSTLTADDAKKLALAKVPGASEQDIVKFETDKDDGHTKYEGEIVFNGMEYEFEIDADYGMITEWEEEPVH